MPFAVATIVTSEQILSAVDESGDDECEATGTERGNSEPVSGPEPRLPVIGTHQGIALDANIEKRAGTRRARYGGNSDEGNGEEPGNVERGTTRDGESDGRDGDRSAAPDSLDLE